MSSSRETEPNWNYEASVAEIEALIEKIESGDLPLETVFSKFEIAVKQIQHCEQFLEQGVKRMELLIETLEDDLDF